MNIGRFHSVTELGRGGMGTVYTGFDGTKKIAIKKFHKELMSEADLVERFKLEARTLQKLHHYSIVKIIEPAYDRKNQFYPAFVENGELYMAMEFVEGDTIDHYVRKNGGPLSEEKAVLIMTNILDAMEHVRQQGIIHRDIKPSNIFIRPDGVSVCIIDFGIVKDLNSSEHTQSRYVMGTDGYMSPEQAKGLTVDYRTDIYSLGCLFFYMLTGTHAIVKRGSDHETRVAIINDVFPRAKDINPLISDRVQAILDKAVNKNMLLRFQSPEEFKNQLKGGGITVGYNPSDGQISVGRESGRDITIYDPLEKVSRHHLDIAYQQTSEGDLYIIRDRSTNGSWLNDQFIRGEEVKLYSTFRGKKIENFPPKIVLADSIELDWNLVIEKLGNKQETGHVVVDDFPPPPVPQPNEKLSVGYGLLSFLFPIVGWVLYYQWKDTKPQKAKQASLIAWIGFIVNLVAVLI